MELVILVLKYPNKNKCNHFYKNKYIMSRLLRLISLVILFITPLLSSTEVEAQCAQIISSLTPTGDYVGPASPCNYNTGGNPTRDTFTYTVNTGCYSSVKVDVSFQQDNPVNSNYPGFENGDFYGVIVSDASGSTHTQNQGNTLNNNASKTITFTRSSPGSTITVKAYIVISGAASCNGAWERIKVKSVLFTGTDNQVPVITCPSDQTLSCNATVPPPNINSVTATDCSPPTITHRRDSVVTTGCTKVTYRIYRATDPCGLFSECIQKFTQISDTNKPTWTTAPNALNTQVFCDDAAALAAAQSSFPVATDNCDPDVSNIVKNSGAFAPSATCPQAGTYTNTWTVTDDCGNVSDVYTQVITVLNNSNFTIPANMSSTVQCPSDAVDPGPPADVTDDCGQVISPTLKTTPSLIPCDGTMVWEYLYSSCNGIEKTWTYTYTIENTTSLVAPLDGSSTVSCPTDAVDPGAPSDIVDACGNSVSAVLSVTPTVISCDGTMDWVYTYTDCSGNSVDWTYTYTIENTTPPTISCPADVIIATCNGTVPPVDISLVSASSYCGSPLTITHRLDSIENVGCDETTYRIYRATDCVGNIAECIQSFYRTVDVTPPVITEAPPPNIIMTCSDPLPTFSNLQASDNCTSVLEATPVIDPYTESCSGYTITVRWTATDDCGNVSAEEIQTLTVLPQSLSIDTPIVSSDIDCDQGTLSLTSSSVNHCGPPGSEIGIRLISCTDCVTGVADTIGTIRPSGDLFELYGSSEATFECVLHDNGQILCTGTNSTTVDFISFCNYNLSIDLTEFEVNEDKCTVIVNWSLDNESEVALYNVQRKGRNGDFETVATIMPKGQSSNKYKYIDADFSRTGDFFYRLEIVDEVGEKTYSNIELAGVHCENIAELQVYPNPTENLVHIVASNIKSSKIDLILLDAIGRVLRIVPLELEDGNGTADIDLQSLPSAAYILQARDNVTKEAIEHIELIKK